MTFGPEDMCPLQTPPDDALVIQLETLVVRRTQKALPETTSKVVAIPFNIVFLEWAIQIGKDLDLTIRDGIAKLLDGYRIRDDLSDSTMMRPSRRVFDLVVVTSSIRPRQHLRFGRGNISDSAIRRPSQRVFDSVAAMSSIQPWRSLRLGHDKAKSKNLQFGHNNVFHSSTTTLPIRP
ncbi:hypothetical protein Cgig2_029710 [Carnegiea gigantea]|uniref:Uncharacterized protein n=1 Tax=Carnegiea gigantea TaxID=171969 RepID=A0A9Q1JNS2_9CARY|nr:hypothetical protein Cgig2_029710 [Carnegiea gigantea]